MTSSLESVYTGDQHRVKLIIKEIRRRIAWPEQMRALGFCVSVQHAEHMTREFQRAGFEATCVTGHTPREVRSESVSALRKGDLQIIFTVDVFNEGIDLPEVDTVLASQLQTSSALFGNAPLLSLE